MIKDSFALLIMLSTAKNQDLRLQAFYFALAVADSVKEELLDEDMARQLQELCKWLVESEKEETVEKCKETAIVAAGLIHDKLKKFIH